jgi:hypothetical protein
MCVRAGACSHPFLLRIELVLKVILPPNHSFQGGEMLLFLQIGLFSSEKKHMYLSKENHLCKKLQHVAHCFTVKIELALKGILHTHHSFHGAGRLNLLQICL